MRRPRLLRRWSRRLPRASARRAPKHRIARGEHRAGEQLDRRPVQPRRRAGPRVAAHDRRDRSRTCAHRRAFHRARLPWRRARQPFPRIAHPRSHRARHARRRCGNRRTTPSASIAERTEGLRESIGRLAGEIRDGVGTMIGEAQGGTDRLVASTAAIRPEIGWIREAAIEASDRISAAGGQIAEQQDRFAALLASVDDGVGDCPVEARRARLGDRQGRARGAQPQRRNRPGARRRTAAGQGSRRARRRARARGDREQSSRKAPGSCRRRRATRSSGLFRESIEERLRRSRTSPRVRSSPLAPLPIG